MVEQPLRRPPTAENPNCDETFATFRVMGPSLDPAEVTALIGIEPTSTHRAGDRVGTLGKVADEAQWTLTSEGTLESTSLELHLRELLDRLEPHRSELRRLLETDDVRADFFCFWSSATGHGGPEFCAGTLARIGSLGATLALDVYA